MDNVSNSHIVIKAPLEFNYIFDDACRVDIESVLCQFSRDRLLNLAILLNRMYCDKPAREICKMLSSDDPNREDLKNRIELFFQKKAVSYVEYVVGFETMTLELLRHTFSISFEKFDKTEKPPNINRLEFQTIKLITQINQELMKYTTDKKDDGKLSILLYTNNASHSDIVHYDPKDEYIAQVVQAKSFFHLLESDSKYDVLLNGFYEKYSISNWREYLRTLISLFGISRKKEGCIKGDLKIDRDSLITRSVLDQLSIPSSSSPISYSSKDEYDKEGNSDYRFFRDRPLFKKENGDYLIHSRPLLTDRIFSSLYFDFQRITENLVGKYPDIANLFTSEFIEKTLFTGWMKECRSSDTIAALDEEELKSRYRIRTGDLGYPDYFLKTERAIILFECKDIRINAWIKEQRDYGILEKELRNKLVSKTYQLNYKNHCHREITPKRVGCGQLAGHIANIRKRESPWDLSLAKDVKVYPVLIIADNRLVVPGLANLLQGWYAECLKKEGLNESSEHSIILMSPLTLIKYSSLFQQDGFQKYFDEYYEFISSNPSDIGAPLNSQNSFDEYMSQYPFNLGALGDEIIKDILVM